MDSATAMRYLAEAVSEAIVNRDCDITVFTGEGVRGGPCRFQAIKLVWALRAAGMERAAKKVEEQAKLTEDVLS